MTPYIVCKITWDKCDDCGYYQLEYCIINTEIKEERLMHICCHCCKGSEYCKPNW